MGGEDAKPDNCYFSRKLLDIYAHRNVPWKENIGRCIAAMACATCVDGRQSRPSRHEHTAQQRFCRKTIALVARELGEGGGWLVDIANGMEPEDGPIWINGPTMKASWHSQTSASKISRTASKSIANTANNTRGTHRML